MTAKPRIRMTTDGRIGWPEVVQYQMLSGPRAGDLLTCPPTVASHPDPATAAPPSIASAAGAKAWRDWMDRLAAGENMARRGCAYRIVIHDHAAHAEMVWTGAIYDPRHTGAGQAEDNRDRAGG
jgi:hypothetical protein